MTRRPTSGNSWGVDVSSLPIEALVPHRSGMLLIDRVLSVSAESVRALAIVRDGLFLRAGRLPAYVGIELMAQTIAAWAGLQHREKNEAVRLGFLLGTRRYEATVDSFAVGTQLEVDARLEIISEQGLAVFSCRIFEGGTERAHASVNVFQPADVERYLKELTV